MAKKKATKKKSATRLTKKSTANKTTKSPDDVAEKLSSLLEKAKSEKQISRLLQPLTEEQRRELAPLCVKNLRKKKKDRFIENPPGTFRMNPLLTPAAVALFWTGNHSEIKAAGFWGLPEGPIIVEILSERKPKWVDGLVEILLYSKNYWNNWATVRELVKLKLCAKPDDPRYYTGMITGLCGSRFNAREQSALSALKADTALLKDEVWRLFEYEGELDNTLANVDQWNKETWAKALRSLAKEGKLSRPRLLSSSLEALQLGFNHYRSKWFMSFFDSLKPNDRELKKLSETILDLVGAQTPNVAKWAYEKTESLYDQKIVKDAARVASAVAPLLHAKQKSTVQTTLKFLDRLATDAPKSVGEICLTATDALGHEKADVQKSALKLIEKHSVKDSEKSIDETLRDSIEKYQSVVAASLRKQLAAFLGAKDTNKKTPAKKQTASAKKKPKAGKVDRKRWSKFPANWCESMELDSIADSIESGAEPIAIPASTLDGTDIPRLIPDCRINPIEDFDELLEVIGRVMENDNLTDDGERAIAGIARLSDQKPNDFDALIGPLRKRALALLKRGQAPFVGGGISNDLCGLVCAWSDDRHDITLKETASQHGEPQVEISGLFDEKIDSWYVPTMPLAFISRRSLSVAKRLNETHQLLSEPTHEGGWIDAIELVARTNDMTDAPDVADLILSLLRLAPDNKATALEKLKPKSSGEWIDAVKYALGGKVNRIGKSAAIWGAAARARSPWDDDAAVAKAFPKIGPGGGKVAQFEVNYFERNFGSKKTMQANIKTSLALPKRDERIPTQLLQLNKDEGSTISFWDLGTTAGAIRWVASMWPSARDSFFATGGQCLFDNLDWWEAAWHNQAYLEPLLDSRTPPRSIGMFMLLCGLAAKEPGEHGLAVDITIAAINDGRIGTDNLSQTFSEHLSQGSFNLVRLSKRFADIAAASDLHALVTMRSWEDSLASFDPKLRGLGDVLELLGEIGATIDRGIENQASRTYLESIRGSNKTAKAGKHLLSLTTNGSATAPLTIALENRIEQLLQSMSLQD